MVEPPRRGVILAPAQALSVILGGSSSYRAREDRFPTVDFLAMIEVLSVLHRVGPQRPKALLGQMRTMRTITGLSRCIRFLCESRLVERSEGEYRPSGAVPLKVVLSITERGRALIEIMEG